jgi:predicted  nucleic acid-binding Zn-ribbon protein
MAEREVTATIKVAKEGDLDAPKQVAEGLDKLGTASKSVAEPLGALKGKFRDAYDAGKDMRAELEAMRAKAEESGSAVTASFAAMERTVGALNKQIYSMERSAGTSLEGFATAAGAAQQRVRELEHAVAELGDQATPELRAELARVQKAFETAFDAGSKTAAQTKANVEEVKERLTQMSIEARNSEDRIRGISDLIEIKFPQAWDVIGKGIAGLAVLKESFGATREAVGLINEVLGVNIDKLIAESGAMRGVAEALVSVGTATNADNQLLENQRKLWQDLGLDMSKFSTNIDANAEAINAGYKKIADGAAAAVEKQKEVTDFLDSIGLSAEKASERAVELGENINQAMTLRPDLDREALATAVRGQIDRALEELKKAGAEIPTALQTALQNLGILTDAFGNVATVSQQSMASTTDAVRAAMDNTITWTRNGVEQVARIPQAAKDAGDAMEGMGDSAAESAGKAEAFVTWTENGAEHVRTLGLHAKEVTDSVSELGTGMKSAGEAGDAAATGLADAGTAIGEMAKGGPDAAESVTGITTALSGSKADIADAAAGMSQFSSSVTTFNPAQMLSGIGAMREQLRGMATDAAAAKAAIESIPTAGQ